MTLEQTDLESKTDEELLEIYRKSYVESNKTFQEQTELRNKIKHLDTKEREAMKEYHKASRERDALQDVEEKIGELENEMYIRNLTEK